MTLSGIKYPWFPSRKVQGFGLVTIILAKSGCQCVPHCLVGLFYHYSGQVSFCVPPLALVLQGPAHSQVARGLSGLDWGDALVWLHSESWAFWRLISGTGWHPIKWDKMFNLESYHWLAKGAFEALEFFSSKRTSSSLLILFSLVPRISGPEAPVRNCCSFNIPFPFLTCPPPFWCLLTVLYYVHGSNAFHPCTI